MIRKSPSDFKFNTTFNNLFTSPKLIVGTEILTKSRTDKCPMRDNKAIGKESRETYHFRYDSLNKTLVVRWKENSVLTLASNCQPVHPVGTSKRYLRTEKKTLDVSEPSLVKYCNKNMGGVD